MSSYHDISSEDETIQGSIYNFQTNKKRDEKLKYKLVKKEYYSPQLFASKPFGSTTLDITCPSPSIPSISKKEKNTKIDKDAIFEKAKLLA